MAKLSPIERRRAAVLAAAIVGLHAIGAFILFGLVMPRHLTLGGQGAFGLGLGLTAYLLGLRHAFDADHISAIDNTTRKLMAEGKRPLSVGFFFSLGHSSVVFVLALLFTLGFGALAGPVRHSGSTLHAVTGLVGTSVSATFLYLIGLLNLVILVGIVRAVRRARRHGFDEQRLASELSGGGAMTRVYGRVVRTVSKPWHMYPIGFLFGLGFDTASEVALLFLAAGAAWSRLPFYAVLCLPILFAAGMTMLDTLDGCFMTCAYGWAFNSPVRKAYFNITITALSVLVALVIGTIELMSILAAGLRLNGGVWHFVTGLDLNAMGLLVVGLFALTWAVALIVWQVAGIEKRWTATGSYPEGP